MIPARTPEPIEMPFEGQAHVGLKNHLLDVEAHPCHLANTTERFVHGGDAALYQIALTTCCCYCHLVAVML